MKSSAVLLSLGLLLGSSASAIAAATAEEAQRLTALFQSYLGPEPGVVTVTPAGDSYAARFDFAPLFAKVKQPGATVSLTPIEWTITDQGAGKWKVDQDQPLAFSLKVEGEIDMKGQVGAIKGTGVFEEALGTFSSSATEFSQVAVDQVITEKGQVSRVNYTIARIATSATMSGTGESADGTAGYSYTDLRQAVSVPAAADGSAPAMDFTIASPSGVQDAVIKGFRPKPVSDLVAWLVARPSGTAIAAEQPALKDKLRAALPLFASISATSTMNELTINTILGKFGVKQLAVGIDMNGVVADGRFRESLAFSGFEAPAELVPPWAAGLVPENFKLDVNVAGFDLAKPAALMIDRLDLSKEDPLPSGMDAELVQALLPTGSVTIGLGPSEILARMFQLTAEGSMTAGPAAMPQGQALLRLKGLDEVMAALQAAPPEFAMQDMAPVFLLARGLAKQEPDGALSWKIESTPGGAVLVNGNDLSALGGQSAPAPAPSP